MSKQIYITERTNGGFIQRTLKNEAGKIIGFDANSDVAVVAAGSAAIDLTTSPLKGNGIGAAVAALPGDITSFINATVAPAFSNISSKPTTVAGWGITNGAAIDSWGTKARPAGTVVGDTDAQTLTNKTISGLENDIAIDAAQISGITTMTLATPLTDKILGFGIATGGFETWGIGNGLSVEGTDPTRALMPSRWLIKVTTYTAVAADKIQADTTAGAFTINLPATATPGDEVRIEDATAHWATANLTINRNGLKINNGTSNFVGATNNQKLRAVYISTAYGWSIK